MARLTPDRLAAYAAQGLRLHLYGSWRSCWISALNAWVVHRAQARLGSQRERSIPTEPHRRLVTAFRTAADTGDLDGLHDRRSPRRGCAAWPLSRRPADPAHVLARQAA